MQTMKGTTAKCRSRYNQGTLSTWTLNWKGILNKQQKSLVHKAVRHEGGWDPLSAMETKKLENVTAFISLR